MVSDKGAIHGSSWIVPGYDATGNMIEGPMAPRAGVANPEQTRHKHTYDAWNRLVQVKDKADATIALCRYDGSNRRIARTDKTGESDVTYDYYYNESWQAVEVHLDGETDYPYKQYVWDLRYIDAPVLRWRDANTDGQDIETLYYCNDANLNVTALVEPDGDVVERYAYDPYGKATFYDGNWENPSTTSAYENEILYTGHRLDTETGLYHVRWRMYHPTLGRWLSRDQMEQALNLYEYAGSNSIRNVDPSGLAFWTIGEECWYTGAEKLEASEYSKTYGGLFGYGGTTVNYVALSCYCQVYCCDFDWWGGWELDEQWDEWVHETSTHWHATYEDDIAEAQFVGEGLGRSLGGVIDSVARKPQGPSGPMAYPDTGQQEVGTMEDALGFAGRAVGLIVAMANPKDAWQEEKKAEMEKFKQQCPSLCQKKEGHEY